MQSWKQYRSIHKRLIDQHGRGNVRNLTNLGRIPGDEESKDILPRESFYKVTANSSSDRKGCVEKSLQSSSQVSSSNQGEAILTIGLLGTNDPNHPQNWPLGRRLKVSGLVYSIGFIVCFASGIDSAAINAASIEFGVSPTAESVTTGVYLIGVGFGSLFAGPLSETFGRNPVYIVTMSFFMIFIMASALAPTVELQGIFRLGAGFFGSTPLSCAGGSLADVWRPQERTYAVSLFAITAFLGPSIAPVIGGWIVENQTMSWRWCDWITLIISGGILVSIIFFLPETYPPTLLAWEAKHLQTIIGKENYHFCGEVRQESLSRRVKIALTRPFAFLVHEPIIILVAAYLTVVLMVTFTSLDFFIFVFSGVYGYRPGMTGTTFISSIVGIFIAAIILPLIFRWNRNSEMKRRATGDESLDPPETRLYAAMIGAPGLPLGLLWMGWTSYPSISVWSSLGASVLIGFSNLCIYLSCYQYVIESYEIYAASALGSVTVIRYIASGIMVVVAIPMCENLGVHWAMTVIGVLSALLIPVPFVFYRCGKGLRCKSKTAKGT